MFRWFEKVILVIMISILILSSFPHNTIPETNKHFSTQPVTIRTPVVYASNYTPHDPISIDDPGDFSSLGFPGTGTMHDPYIISNISIESAGICLEIVDITDHIEIRNCTFIRTYHTEFYDAECVVLDTIPNINVYFCEIINGTILQKTSGTTNIYSNQFLNCPTGCWLDANAFVSNNTFCHCKYGLYITEHATGIIRNNTMLNCNSGIRLMDSDFLMTENSFIDCVGGISCFSDSGCISQNRFIRNWKAIVAHSVPVTGNIIENCKMGISADGFQQCYFTNNTITSFEEFGIEVDQYSKGAIVKGNKIHGRGVNGISILHENVVIEDNMLQDCGITFLAGRVGERAKFQNNTINGRPHGFFNDTTGVEILDSSFAQVILLNCSDSLVSNAIFTRVPSGVTLMSSDNSLISNCTFDDCSSGILQRFTQAVIIQSCAFIDCGLSLEISSLEEFPEEIASCTVNGKLLAYLKNEANVELIAENHGQIIVVASTNVSIRGGVISNASMGVVLGYSTNCTIENVVLEGHKESGVFLYESRWNIINGCQFLGNGYGYIPKSSDHNLIVNNVFLSNRIGVYACGPYSQFYYNILGRNTEWNVRSSAITTVWDDSTGCGNWWDDWDGSSFYHIATFENWLDGFITEIVDRFPNGTRIDHITPQLSHPTYLQFYVDENPKVIYWNCSDENPRFYSLYVNGTLVETDYWYSGVEVETILLLTSVGVYNVTLVLEDYGINRNSGTVLVSILEGHTITPTTTSPTTSTSSSPTTTPSTTQPYQDWSEALVIGSAGIFLGTVTIILILTVIEKKSARRTT